MFGLPIKIIKICYIRGTYVVFEVKYIRIGWSKSMESTSIYYYAIGLTVDTTIDFALSFV